MKNILIILSTVFLYSCSGFSSKEIEEKVEENVKLSESDMVKKYNRSKDTLDLLFQNVIQSVRGSSSLNNIQKFYAKEIETLNFIDSLRNALGQLDKMDLNNVENIKENFIKNGLADTVFYKCNEVYYLAEKAALSLEMKNEIKKSNNNLLGNFEQKKQQYFGLNNSLGVSMILYGFQEELIKTGNQLLGEYEKEFK